MELKPGCKVVIYNDKYNFRGIDGLEGYIGVGTFLGFFEDEKGFTSKKAKLDNSDIILDDKEQSNISFYDPKDFTERLAKANEDIEKKQRFINIASYEVELAIFDNERQR